MPKPRTVRLPGSLEAIEAKIASHNEQVAHHTNQVAYYQSMRDTYFKFHPASAAPPALKPESATIATPFVAGPVKDLPMPEPEVKAANHPKR